MTGRRRNGRRTGRLPSVLLIAAGWALAACAAPAPIGSLPSTGTPLAITPSGGGTAQPTATTPQPTITAPSASAPPSASPTPAPSTTGLADGAVAEQTASTYVGNLAAGRYKKAWLQLSLQSQQQSGSFDAFMAERSAFFASAGKRFTVSAPDNAATALTQWLPQGFDGQKEHAYVLTVQYPQLAGNNAGFEVFVVAPNGVGEWLIWVVR